MDSDPVNYRRRDPAAIPGDIEYAFALVRAMEHAIGLTGLSLEGLRILELGPGPNFAPQLILASRGAQITLADRFLGRWDPGYHPEFYRRIAERCDVPYAELDAVVRAGSHEASSLVLLEEPAEELRSVPDAAIDLVYSNAVLEHVRDIGLVAAETHRVTRDGGWGYHQIDWRYHKDFDRPLDHVPLPDEVFRHEADATNFEVGNRVRSIEFWATFEAAGLSVVQRSVNMAAGPDYFDVVLPAIRDSASSYRDWPRIDLERTSGFLLLRRDGAQAARERGADTLSLIESLKSVSRVTGLRAQEERSAELPLDPTLIHWREGHLWRQMLPELPLGDSVEHGSNSELVLLEDGRPLGPGHSPLAAVVAQGEGRYAHWMKELHFATSDNSSPVENGRRYSIRVPKTWLPG